jgi:uridine kinase
MNHAPGSQAAAKRGGLPDPDAEQPGFQKAVSQARRPELDPQSERAAPPEQDLQSQQKSPSPQGPRPNIDPRLPFPPTVLAIAGCSGSGKTTLADELARTLHGLRFHLDDYYLDLTDLPLAERVKKNFDDPALIEVPLLARHIAALARGETIDRPVYDFGTYTRVPGRSQRVAAGPFLIVEGLFALYYSELLPFYHLRVYVDAPDALCFERRLKRDVEERGRTPELVREQYDRTVRPTGAAYVRPSAKNADLIVDGTGALDWKVERVMTEMRKLGLLAGAE